MKIKIYDNGGKTLDRYTVAILDTYRLSNGAKLYECLGVDDVGGQGFSQMSECQLGRHLGKLIKWEDLPIPTRFHIKDRLED